MKILFLSMPERFQSDFLIKSILYINNELSRLSGFMDQKSTYNVDNSNRSRAQIKRREREKSSVRAKVEHVFAVVKQQLRFRKTRYRGLRKQTAKLNILFALANLILADRPCLAA